MLKTGMELAHQNKQNRDGEWDTVIKPLQGLEGGRKLLRSRVTPITKKSAVVSVLAPEEEENIVRLLVSG